PCPGVWARAVKGSDRNRPRFHPAATGWGGVMTLAACGTGLLESSPPRPGGLMGLSFATPVPEFTIPDVRAGSGDSPGCRPTDLPGTVVACRAVSEPAPG